MNIADLHCDLLSYLALKDERNAENPESRCSLPQLRKGNVIFQTLAVFSETGKKSVFQAEKQFTIFQTLPKLYPGECKLLKELNMPNGKEETVYLIAAIENMSGLCGENEHLENCFSRFDQYRGVAGPILYASLTWHDENRFGGGDNSKVGIKRDGEIILDYLNEKEISIDLSHASDALAEDILNYIDKKGLKILPIASHSNFRSVMNHARNLPDRFAKEIVKRGGVIGINFVKHFIGKRYPEDFLRHVEHAHSLGLINNLCFGADFFYDKDTPITLHPFIPLFYSRFGDASCYPDFIDYLSEVFPTNELEKIASKNLADFFIRKYTRTPL